VKIIVVQDLDPGRAPSYTVATYVWAVLKIRALGRELGHTLLEAERRKAALMSTRQADALWAEAQAFLKELEAEAEVDDAYSRP
jgi:hypothetical protein